MRAGSHEPSGLAQMGGSPARDFRCISEGTACGAPVFGDRLKPGLFQLMEVQSDPGGWRVGSALQGTLSLKQAWGFVCFSLPWVSAPPLGQEECII